MRAREFQSQPFFVAEPWTARPGTSVPLEVALRGNRAIVEGTAEALRDQDLLQARELPT